MDLHLKNKTALITGSTKGIGKAIATQLALEDANVIINGRTDSAVEKLSQKSKATTLTPK